MNRVIFILFGLLLPIALCGCVSGRAADRTPAMPPSTATPARPSPIRFREVAAEAGLHYRWPSNGPRPRTILQTIGYGCAFLDYNRDGSLDILLIGPKLALYRGDGHGHFTDVTHAAGLDRFHGVFFGCAVGDYDNDGYDDLYVSGYRGGMLLHNEQGHGFTDRTMEMGLTPQPWGTSCAWTDLNGDGYLDLIVCNYVAYDSTSIQHCKMHDVLTACPPQTYKPLFTSVFENHSGRHFTEATVHYLATKTGGNSLGVAVADADGTGHLCLAVANDLMPGNLYRRKENENAYIDIGPSSGTATDGTGNLHAGMGADWGDVDNDGKLDLFVTTFALETKCLYRNLGNGVFEEDAHLAGIGTTAWNYVAFGCKFLDADNDGWLDLIIANGHTSDNIHDISAHSTYRQPIQFFRNLGDHPVKFSHETATFSVTPLAPIVGRGLAVGDYDNDGRMDALIVDGEGAPLLLHNETPSAANWLTLHLTGSGKSNRDAYGARVTVLPETDSPLVRECEAGGSYLSSSDPRVHFGVGRATKANVTVRWPDGQEQTWKDLTAGRLYRLEEGETVIR